MPDDCPCLPDLIEAKRAGGPRFAAMRAAYEREQGKILEEFYALDFRAAVLLVAAKERKEVNGGAERAVLKMRLYYDPLESTTEVDDVFQSARRVERKYSVLLRGETQEILARGIYTTAVVLLSVLDAMVGSPHKPERVPAAAASARKEIRQIEQNARDAALDRALIRYLGGLAVGAVLALAVVVGLNFVPMQAEFGPRLLTCLVSGAVGAILSVMTRTANRERVRVGLDQGRVVVFLSGGFRLIIGAIFGAAMFVLVGAGLLPIAVPAGPEQVKLFFAGLAFLAGFSERWAQDTIVRTLPGAVDRNAVEPARGKDG
ncbi:MULTISPECIES: hypothetical protein [Amycolatopsis]|uniref:Uncharacterized protein n=1 Tax=Amycolatopsis bullii TaxID=941987 RepID=A0ABQ3JWJ5_9PSEU|nr:hypothetical protein [Amycolatopsis bullii]GHF93144.1 hypothetical protein GCM10017567_04640 [Amycolatopsis bullii]